MNTLDMSVSNTRAADTDYLVRQAMSSGYQLFSLLVPPAYATFVLTRRGRTSLTLNRLLRATWIGGATGTVISGCFAYARCTYSREEQIKTRRVETTYDPNRIRANDHAMIGTVLMGVLTPALLWNRANIINLILGGAGFGSSMGLITHYGRFLSGDPSHKVPKPPTNM